MVEKGEPVCETRREMGEQAYRTWLTDPDTRSLTWHFEQVRLSERKAIVDWLRAEHLRIRKFLSPVSNLEQTADAIESGAHEERG